MVLLFCFVLFCFVLLFNRLNFYDMKKLLFIGVSSVLMLTIISSCKKNNNPISNSSSPKTAQAQSLLIDTAGFTTDSLTEAFILKATEVKYSAININVINAAIADDTITDVEMANVANAFGFSSTDRLINYLKDLQDLKTQLFEKYQLNKKDPSEVNLLFQSAMLSYLNRLASQLELLKNLSNPQTTGFSCGENLATCTAEGFAFEAVGLNTCNAGWVYPPVAVLCYAGVMTATYFKLQGCSDSYNLCQSTQSDSYLAQAIKMTFYE